MAHIWKVTGEDSWIPTQEFITQLQQEVYNRRVEVQKMLASPRGMAPTTQNQHGTISQLQNNAPQLPKVLGAPTFCGSRFLKEDLVDSRCLLKKLLILSVKRHA